MLVHAPPNSHGGPWRRRFVALAILALAAGIGSDLVCRHAGHWLVRADALQPADALLVSVGGWYAGAVEAARLQRAGTALRVVATRWSGGPGSADTDIRRLGISLPTPREMIQSILERSGVPSTAIEWVDHEVNGTGPDIATLAAYVRMRQWKRVIVLTSRSHSRRAGWLLERALPSDVTVQVHSPANDEFDPTTWWRSREMTREVIIESLRWLNALVLSDPWRD